MRLLYFSPVPAASYAQRPHFMVRAWLDRGIESVCWVEPYPSRLPHWRDVRRRPSTNQGEAFDSRVEVLRVPALPIEPLPGGSRLNRWLLWRPVWRRLSEFAAAGRVVLGIGKPCRLALDALAEIPAAFSFYDAMDDFPEFHRGLSRCNVARLEGAIARGVDLVVASSTTLAEKFSSRGCDVERILNAYPMHSVAPLEPRGELPPVAGYIGCLGPWFDWPLVLELAGELPDVRFELIGPCAVSPPRRRPANICLLPACRREEAAAHASSFSAGLIPFRRNRLTAGVDPIKYYEYRALGLSVLSTRFGEMAVRSGERGLFFLEHGQAHALLARAAMDYRSSAAEVAAFRRENCWQVRFNGTRLFGVLDSRSRRAA